MIGNLNPIAFKGYGTVLPERAHAGKKNEKDSRFLRDLPQGETVIYRAKSEVWLDFGTGMTVLSVSCCARSLLSVSACCAYRS